MKSNEPVEELRSMFLELRELLLRQNDDLATELRETLARALPDAQEDAGAASYRRMVRRVRELVSGALPREATVAVVSRGDEQLLSLYGRRGWHFPQTEDGTYAGYHPADSASAIAHLEALRQKGAEYLLVPGTAFWWFGHYPELHRHLERRYEAVLRGDECTVYALRARPADRDPEERPAVAELVGRVAERLGRAPAVLDLTGEGELARVLTDCTVFAPPTPELPLPYLDRTIDLVVVGDASEELLEEGWRVAETALLELRHRAGAPPTATIRWRSSEPRLALPSVSIIVHSDDPLVLERMLAAARESVSDHLPCELLASSGDAASLNATAERASGELLAFVGDAAPTPGWLPPLLALLRDRRDAGAVVGRVVYPEGRLREAGCVFLSDGTLVPLGRDDAHVGAPAYSHVREVDGCSGGVLATRREIFREVGGFRADPDLGPLALADFCFAVREAGHRVLYQPESMLIHQGADRERDAGSLLAPLAFRRRWGGRLRNHPLGAGWFDLPALRSPATVAGNGLNGGGK